MGPSLTLRVTILPSRGAMFLAIVALASIGWAMEGGPTPADGLLQDTPAAGAAQAVAAPDELLLGSGPPDRQAVEQLVGRFGSRDPLVREAAIRRLTPYPEAARAAVVKAFRDGNLATRLAALDLLGQWRAPVAGLDPWRPETISPAALAELEKWLSQQPGAPAAHPAVLSREELEEARREIDRLLRGPPEEAAARREQLARWGAALLPEVYARLRQAEGDEDRRRLLALRYRLVASGSLVLRWPGGLERLASNDTAQRQKAAEELAGQAAAEDQPLLLELFSDPDPLVREISLRGVQAIGGASATAALVRLLDDPEPNVRAAVLKQLAEEPSRAMVPKIAEYLTREKDADLVVHAIRFLKAAAGPEAVKSLLAVLDHPQWQVRAEAAEALGGLVEKDDVPESLKADAYVALIRKLDDPDGFVVSRALDGLGSADLEMAVEPMLRAAAAHPELAGRLIELSVSNGNLRAKALPKLREFTRHGNATVRAAAIRNLCGVMPDAMPDVIAAGLGDPESRVRTAAAWALNQMLAREHPAIRSDAERFGPFTRTWISSDGPLPESVEKWIQAARAAEPQASGGWRYRPEAAPAESSPERPSQVGDVPAAGQPAPLDADYAPAADQPPATEPPPAADQPPTTAPLPAADRPAPSPVLGPPGMGRSAFAVMPSYDPPWTPGGFGGRENPAAQFDGPQWDQWLESVYAGEHRPKWTGSLAEPLQAMLAAPAAEERLEAALALVPLGHGDQALPALLETTRAAPEMLDRAEEVLPWLVWQKRQEVFAQLRGLAGDARLPKLVHALALVSDERAAPLLWQILGEKPVSEDTASALEEALRQACFGSTDTDAFARAAPKKREAFAAEAKQRATSGGDWQRLVSLVLLARVDAAAAAEIVRPMADDPQLSEALRRDAFQLLLLSQEGRQRVETAIAALRSDEADRRKLALAYLAEGADAISWVRDRFYVSAGSSDDPDVFSRESGQPIIPVPPRGLKAEDVRPLLGDPDPQIAAQAAYLLALCKDRQGLEALLALWGKPDGEAQVPVRYVYRAIAVLDEAKYVPELRKIYEQYGRTGGAQYAISEFYWTIRIMSGPEILKLRKQIRDEVGMEQLR